MFSSIKSTTGNLFGEVSDTLEHTSPSKYPFTMLASITTSIASYHLKVTNIIKQNICCTPSDAMLCFKR
jgi:hypothetical protein